MGNHNYELSSISFWNHIVFSTKTTGQGHYRQTLGVISLLFTDLLNVTVMLVKV